MSEPLFQCRTVRDGDASVVEYSHGVWDEEPVTHELDGQRYPAKRRTEVLLRPTSVMLREVLHLQGVGLPTDARGRTLQPTRVLVELRHDALLEAPERLRDAGGGRIPDARWPAILEEAVYIVDKARGEGRWRRNLQVRITATQVTDAVARIRAGATLSPPATYSREELGWDAARRCFWLHRSTEYPYTGEVREDRHSLDEAEVRTVVEGIPAARLAAVLR